MTGDDGTEPLLATALEHTRLGAWELWLRYFALRGSATVEDVLAHIDGTERLSSHEHDVLVLALNERFSEMDLNHPVPYSRE